METLEELQKILDDAPEGATHLSSLVGQSRYLKHNVRRDFVYHDGRTFCNFPSRSGYLRVCESIRKLSDIHRIVELMKSQQGLLEIFASVEDGLYRNQLLAARKSQGF